MADKKTTTKAPKVTKVQNAEEVKTLPQLKEELETLQNDYRESRRSHLLGELVNPRVLREGRKAIARTLTAIKQAENVDTKPVKEEN